MTIQVGDSVLFTGVPEPEYAAYAIHGRVRRLHARPGDGERMATVEFLAASGLAGADMVTRDVPAASLAPESLHEQRLRLAREGHPAVQDGPYAYIQQDGYMAGGGVTGRDVLLSALADADDAPGAPSFVGRIVARAEDDSPCPLTGRVTGQVDEDRVEVAWGDAQYSETARPSTEWIDELRPVRG